MNPATNGRESRPSFSDSIATILRRFGWFPGRNVNIEPFVAALEKNGYTVFPAVQKFLREFGGITLDYRRDTPYGRLRKFTSFDVEVEASALFPEILEDYESFLSVPLCIIGITDGRETTLLMDPAGKIYGVYDERIIFCGETGSEAIENILNNKNIKILR